MKWSKFNVDQKKRWRRRAKRWLVNNEITGANGLYGDDEAEELVESLAKQFASI